MIKLRCCEIVNSEINEKIFAEFCLSAVEVVCHSAMYPSVFVDVSSWL